jgi:hypothetical protein
VKGKKVGHRKERKSIAIIVPELITVAFVTLAERKVGKGRKEGNEEYSNNSTSIDNSSICDISRKESVRVDADKKGAKCSRDRGDITADK